LAKHTQQADLATTWTIDSSDDVWVLGTNAKITVGDDIGEEYGIFVDDAHTGNTVIVKGDVKATAPLATVAIYLEGAETELKVLESSTLKATTGIYSTAPDASIRNGGTIEATLTGIYADGAKTLTNTGDITGETGIYSLDTGRIVNSGEIDGAMRGIEAVGVDATIINGKGGLISSDDQAISVDADAMRIVNRGKIEGTTFAVVDQNDGALMLVNRGKIDGDILLGSGDDTFDTRGGKFDGIVGGGAGDDTFKVSSSKVTIEEGTSSGYDRVSSSVSFELANNVERLTLVGKADIDGRGNETENDLVGNSGDNRLFGDAGEDTLFGGAGKDVLRGGADADTFYFGKNSDIDIIRDFTDGDLLSLTFITNIGDAEDLLENHVEKSGDDLVITYGNDKLILENTKLSDLTVDDFMTL
jgi:Ca2+-binding RTX toxin-like protein